MVEINLLPQNMQRQTDTNAWKLASVIVPVVGVLAMLGLTIATNAQLNQVNRQLADVNAQIDVLQPSKSEYDALVRQRNELTAVTATADALLATKSSWSADLARFVNNMPTSRDVSLLSLTMAGAASAAPTATAAAGGQAQAAPAVVANGANFDGKAISKTFTLSGQARSAQALETFLNRFENSQTFGVNLNSATRDQATGLFSFSAVVGLVAAPVQATPASTPATSTGAASTAPAAAPTTNGSSN